jgi:hypothetical protein
MKNDLKGVEVSLKTSLQNKNKKNNFIVVEWAVLS